MLGPLSAARQASINAICSYFVAFEIHSTRDLNAQFEKIIPQINMDPNIFRPTDSLLQRIALFSAAVAAYASITEYKIRISSDNNLNLLKQQSGGKIAKDDDLYKVTQSYDQLLESSHSNKATSNAITRLLKSKNYGVCDTIILGAGDTGTTLWLEKYKSQHGKTHKALSEKKLPNVLMISDGFGSWKHDYTLAQPQSSLERSSADKNPSDFMSAEFYEKNPQVNARHVFQANQVCLGVTQAPLLKSNVQKIEKRANHADWQNIASAYRLIIQTSKGETKAIYANNIEICTGLGAANVAFNEKVIASAEIKKLNQFDDRLGFTPVVDGNQFVLSSSEEGGNARTIVIYGGGGTASACYRKSFFGTDIRTYDRPYTPENQKNKVLWVYKDFIGTGKMAENALLGAQERNEVFTGELLKITPSAQGKLSLEFKLQGDSSAQATKTVICDQLVYSIGQNDIRARQVCSEVGSDLHMHTDPSGMLLYITTPDQRIRYFGAAAVAFSKAEFLEETMKWLNQQNIGGDVGAGSMPPTRAQIKRHLALLNIKPDSINTNMDTSPLIKEFLVQAGITPANADYFIQDVLLARKQGTSGSSNAVLIELLNKHNLNAVFNIYGHSHLILKHAKKERKSSTLPILTLLDNKKSKPTGTADDLNLDIKYSFPLNPISPLDSSAGLSPLRQEVTHSAAAAHPSIEGMFATVRRKETTDSFAFVSTATNTNTDINSEAKNTVTLAPSIKTNGS
jgi:hypothetical protein